MKSVCLMILLLFSGTLMMAQHLPSAATTFNVGFRTADTIQTCQHLNRGNWREMQLPTQSCAGVAAINAGFASGSWLLDRMLRKHHHPKLAFWQWVSAAGSAEGIIFTYTIGSRKKR